jgi:hypothetical protein
MKKKLLFLSLVMSFLICLKISTSGHLLIQKEEMKVPVSLGMGNFFSGLSSMAKGLGKTSQKF